MIERGCVFICLLLTAIVFAALIRKVAFYPASCRKHYECFRYLALPAIPERIDDSKVAGIGEIHTVGILD